MLKRLFVFIRFCLCLLEQLRSRLLHQCNQQSLNRSVSVTPDLLRVKRPLRRCRFQMAKPAVPEAEWRRTAGSCYMLVFASIPCFELLAGCAVWSFDGTFDSSPRQFAQLFTIHGFVHSVQMPLVFALLENKDSVTYTQLSLNLKELVALYIV